MKSVIRSLDILYLMYLSFLDLTSELRVATDGYILIGE